MIELLVTYRLTLDVSYNQPRFAPCASWDPNAITFADSSLLGYGPFNIFINKNNTICVSAPNLNLTVVFASTNYTSPRYIGTGLAGPRGLFVTINDDIYVDNGLRYGRVEKWTISATSGTSVMNVNGSCFSLFVDTISTLYCSLGPLAIVVKRSLADGINTSLTVAAGNGTPGTSPSLLYSSNGIFVDSQLNLYVADCDNNRVQRFALDQLSGTPVAGVGASGTIDLHWPTDVILDGDDFLFIVDNYNHRIVGSGPAGFRCIVGCSGGGGTAPSQLNQPRSLAFDSEGNLFVVDSGNGRSTEVSIGNQYLQ